MDSGLMVDVSFPRVQPGRASIDEFDRKNIRDALDVDPEAEILRWRCADDPMAMPNQEVLLFS
eukprot:1241844-Amorphochlora_amoeboformis.AAC.1